MYRASGSVVDARASFDLRRLCFAVASRCFCNSSHSRIAVFDPLLTLPAARSRAARWRRVSLAPVGSSANRLSVSTCSRAASRSSSSRPVATERTLPGVGPHAASRPGRPDPW